MTRTRPGSWMTGTSQEDWRRQTAGQPVRLLITCRREGYEPWLMPYEIIKPEELRLVSIVDDLQPENNLHYVHVSFEQADPAWDPRIMEPDRCEEWRYFPLGNLPENVFPPHEGIVANYLHGRLYDL
jgi:hypothetical protein